MEALNSSARIRNTIAIRDSLYPLTSIEDVWPAHGEEDAWGGQTHGGETWYTLSGVKLPARPTQAGLYICNGRKVSVK